MWRKKKQEEEPKVQEPAQLQQQISFVDQFILEGVKANWKKLPVINADKMFCDLLILMHKTYVVPAEEWGDITVCLINNQLFNIVLNQQPNGTTAPANQ